MSTDEDKGSVTQDSGEAEGQQEDTEEQASSPPAAAGSEQGEDYAEWKKKKKSKKKKEKGEGEKSQGRSQVLVSKTAKSMDMETKRDFQVLIMVLSVYLIYFERLNYEDYA